MDLQGWRQIRQGALVGACLLLVSACHAEESPGISGDAGSPDAEISQDAAPPPDTQVTLPSRCGVVIDEFALVQAVGQSLWPADGAEKPVVLVAGKAAEAVVRLERAASSAPRVVTVRLLVENDPPFAGASFEQTIELGGVSPKGAEAPSAIASFFVEGALLAPGVRVGVEILLGADCDPAPGLPGIRLPAAGLFAPALATPGGLKIRLVPIRYDADGSGRLPDLSPEFREGLARYLEALYPVEFVRIEVREPVGGTVSLADREGWDHYLTQVAALRAADAPADDEYYMGLVSPTVSQADFCKPDCQGGTAFLNAENAPAKRAGVALGFATGARLFAHELGHAHGLGHAPCGATEFLDPDFPDPRGRIGREGFDRARCEVVAADRSDFMGNCEDGWMSPYHHQRLLERIAMVNGRTNVLSFDGSPSATFQCMVGPPRPGVVAVDEPSPAPVDDHPAGSLAQAGALTIGEGGAKRVAGVAGLASGEVVVVGSFSGRLRFGATELVSAGDSDVFVAKLTPSGGTVWALRAGGEGPDRAGAVAIGPRGQIHVAGGFAGSARFGHLRATAGAAPEECFVARLQSDGTFLSLAITEGQSSSSGCRGDVGLAVDEQGRASMAAVITGVLGLRGLAAVESADEVVNPRLPRLLVAGTDGEGLWQWARSAGQGLSTIAAPRLAVSPAGDHMAVAASVRAHGRWNGEPLETANADVLVVGLDRDRRWSWHTTARGALQELVDDIAMDAAGNLYLAGAHGGGMEAGGFSLAAPPTWLGVFTARIDGEGAWTWLSGDLRGRARAMVVLSDGRLAVAGEYGAAALLSSFMLPQPTAQTDVFVALLDGGRGTWLSGRAVGVQSPVELKGLTVAGEAMWAVGDFGMMTGTSITLDGSTITSGGRGDALVWKFQPTSLHGTSM